jgi:hypothetical protein
MESLARLLPSTVSVAIGGNGWSAHRKRLPPHWVFAGALQGRTYVEWLRQGRICLGLVSRTIVVDGREQPGDEDTTRTYELAAAHCFFIHRRTDLVKRLYCEMTEVPMFETAEELAEKVVSCLARPDDRRAMAAAAHRRAVPSYGIDARAAEIVSALRRVPGRRAATLSHA